eukprot:1144348-Pelagomonas_calceolata.AAC.2
MTYHAECSITSPTNAIKITHALVSFCTRGLEPAGPLVNRGQHAPQVRSYRAHWVLPCTVPKSPSGLIHESTT